jgi:hypothetical protein
MRSILYDAALIAGGGLVTYAAWLVAPPLGFLVAGLLLAAFGIIGAAANNQRKR